MTGSRTPFCAAQSDQAGGIGLPDALARALDLLAVLELGVEEGGQDVGGQVAGADVDPGVFVHLPAEEAAAVGAFLADDLGALDQGAGR